MSRSADALPDPVVATLRAGYTFPRPSPRSQWAGVGLAAAFRREITARIIPDTAEYPHLILASELFLNYVAPRNTRADIFKFKARCSFVFQRCYSRGNLPRSRASND